MVVSALLIAFLPADLLGNWLVIPAWVLRSRHEPWEPPGDLDRLRRDSPLFRASPASVSTCATPSRSHRGTNERADPCVFAELDRVIHEPGRLMIVALLYAVEGADFLYLQHETEMNKGTLSSHLARLEEAGYVEVEKTYRGQYREASLTLHEWAAKPLTSTAGNSNKRCSSFFRHPVRVIPIHS